MVDIDKGLIKIDDANDGIPERIALALSVLVLLKLCQCSSTEDCDDAAFKPLVDNIQEDSNEKYVIYRRTKKNSISSLRRHSRASQGGSPGRGSISSRGKGSGLNLAEP